MVTAGGGSTSLGLLSTPPPDRTPKYYTQARYPTKGCPGGSGWGEDPQTRAGRWAESLGRGKTLGQLGGALALLEGLCHLIQLPGAGQAG